MATFKAQADFINENVSLLANRQGSMYSAFLESRPTFVTYFHINKIHSRTDAGLKMPEKLNGIMSPIRYNKINKFPIYGIEQIQLQLDEDEEGLNTDYSGEAIILPNTIHPTVDDYFIINYLEKSYMFRVTKYEYDTIKSNNYYKIEFTLQSVDVDFYNDIENQVVKTYNTKFENVGTEDNVFISQESEDLLILVNDYIDSISKAYLDAFFEPTKEPYNTLLFIRPSTTFNSDYDYIFNQNLVAFCNKNHIFYKHNTTDAILFYEEPKKFFHIEYDNSIFSLIENAEYDRFDKITRYFDLEPTVSMDSIFLYYRDKRVKYFKDHMKNQNVYGGETELYIPSDFIDSVINKDISNINRVDAFIIQSILGEDDIDNLITLMKNLPLRHIRYSLHNFIFIPILLFYLKKLADNISSTSISEVDGLADELANESSVENI